MLINRRIIHGKWELIPKLGVRLRRQHSFRGLAPKGCGSVSRHENGWWPWRFHVMRIPRPKDWMSKLWFSIFLWVKQCHFYNPLGMVHILYTTYKNDDDWGMVVYDVEFYPRWFHSSTCIAIAAPQGHPNMSDAPWEQGGHLRNHGGWGKIWSRNHGVFPMKNVCVFPWKIGFCPWKMGFFCMFSETNPWIVRLPLPLETLQLVILGFLRRSWADLHWPIPRTLPPFLAANSVSSQRWLIGIYIYIYVYIYYIYYILYIYILYIHIHLYVRLYRRYFWPTKLGNQQLAPSVIKNNAGTSANSWRFRCQSHRFLACLRIIRQPLTVVFLRHKGSIGSPNGGRLELCRAPKRMGTLPSGKRLHNYGKIHHFEWENQLFLWLCSIALLNYQRLNVIIVPLYTHYIPMNIPMELLVCLPEGIFQLWGLQWTTRDVDLMAARVKLRRVPAIHCLLSKTSSWVRFLLICNTCVYIYIYIIHISWKTMQV